MTAHKWLGELIQPTNKVFIRTYETIKYGAQDKLKYLFASRKIKYKIEKIVDLQDDCFEVIFKIGWGKNFTFSTLLISQY